MQNERSAKRKSMIVNDNTPSASERCAAADEICVKRGSGMFPRQAIYRLLSHAGAYKSCTSGYRRAQLAKTLEYYKPINQI